MEQVMSFQVSLSRIIKLFLENEQWFGSPVRNWSDLDNDLLSAIAVRINCLRDFIIFGAVCRSWRSVASPEKFKKSPRIPWLLLDQKVNDFSRRKLLNLSEDVIYRINLPKPRGFHLWKYTRRIDIKEKHYLFSRNGWFLTVENDLQLSLLNPFSLSRIDLPYSFIPLEKLGFIYPYIINFALSSGPTDQSDFTIMILYFICGVGIAKLGFCKNGDRQWTDVDFELRLSTSDVNITYHNGRFYVVHLVYSRREFVVHEVDIRHSRSVSIRSKSFSDPSMHFRNPFWIIGSSRMLMMVTWRLEFIDYQLRGGRQIIVGDLYSHVPHFQFVVEEIDFEKGDCRKVTNFGDEALFLGYCSSFLVDVSNESRFKSNHIYFVENFQETWLYHRGGGVGVYSMVDGSSKPLFSREDSGYGCSSQWIEPRR